MVDICLRAPRLDAPLDLNKADGVYVDAILTSDADVSRDAPETYAAHRRVALGNCLFRGVGAARPRRRGRADVCALFGL